MVASAVGLPTVCHQSDPVRLSATHCSVPGPRRTLGSALSRTPSPVVRSTAVPAGGYRGAHQFPLVARGSTMRIGRGLHPIQVRPSRMMDVELDVSERWHRSRREGMRSSGSQPTRQARFMRRTNESKIHRRVHTCGRGQLVYRRSLTTSLPSPNA